MKESETCLNEVTAHHIIKCLTGNRLQKWRGFSPSLLTPTMAHVFGICCFNWIPNLRTTTVTKGRAKFLYKLDKGMQFNFGKLVHDQISRIAENLQDAKTLLFPSLIYQVLKFQRDIPLLPEEVFDAPIKMLKPDIRSGRGRLNNPAPTFEFGISIRDDLRHIRDLLDATTERLERGDYGVPFQDEGFEAQGSVLGATTLAKTESSENEESCSQEF